MEMSITIVKLNECSYEATCSELPDCAEYGDTPEEALALILDSIKTTNEYLLAKKRKKLILDKSAMLIDEYLDSLSDEEFLEQYESVKQKDGVTIIEFLESLKA